MTKLLLFSDLHADPKSIRNLLKRSAFVDVLVGAGDFGNVRRDLQMCIDELRTFDKPAVLVPGNNESTEELEKACHVWPSAHVLHGSGVVISGIQFFGIGGGIPVTPFGPWSYDFTEEEANELLQNCPPGCVLVSHSPPKGAVDKAGGGQSLGSIAVRDAVERTQPLLVVCGHIHASGGQHTTIGRTAVVNAGSTGVEWELADTTMSKNE
jgi:Icc-related predicted phosphoesterase